jgi:hypothetical protein
VRRTFKSELFFQQEPNQQCLRRVLLTFACRHPEVAYLQGMNYIAATLLVAFAAADTETNADLATSTRPNHNQGNNQNQNQRYNNYESVQTNNSSSSSRSGSGSGLLSSPVQKAPSLIPSGKSPVHVPHVVTGIKIDVVGAGA